MSTAAATTSHSVGSACASSTATCGSVATTPTTRSFDQRRRTATIAVPAKTSAANAVPAALSSPACRPTAPGARVAPTSPRPATSSEPQASAVTTPAAAIPAAMTSARPVRHEVVEHLRGEQGHVAAGDPGADRRERGVVHVREAPLDVEARREEERGRQRAERDARDRADPAAVDREHEEEDDPEQRHRAAGPGERLRSEEGGPVDLLADARRLRSGARRPRRS